MAYHIQKVIDIALAEVGYLEKESESQLDSKTGNAGDKNYTKYARDLATISYFNGGKQGVAWCATFVCWCFVQAFGKAAALALLFQPKNNKNNCGAGCKYARNYFKAKGRLFDSPKVGDVVFFYSSDKSSIAHTGLVYKVNKSKVYTVEGNTSGASGVVANGGGVFKKSYSLSYGRLAGFGRPIYGSQEAFNGSQSASDVKDEETVKDDNKTAQNANLTAYTVKKNDTLWKIAKKYLGKGNRYTEIKTINGLKTNLIKPGQVLKIPTND